MNLRKVMPLEAALKIRDGQEIVLVTFDLEEEKWYYVDPSIGCSLRRVKMSIPREETEFVRLLEYSDATGKILSSWEYYWRDYFRPRQEGGGYYGAWGLKLSI